MRTTSIIVALLITLAAAGCQRPIEPTVDGSWKFVPEKSTDLATWRYRLPQLSIDSTDAPVRILLSWMERSRAAFVDTFFVDPGGETREVTIYSRLWPANWYMGVLAIEHSTRTMHGSWTDRPRGLDFTSEQPVSISQGETPLTTHWELRVDPETGFLTLREQRSSRPTPIVMVFERLED